MKSIVLSSVFLALLPISSLQAQVPPKEASDLTKNANAAVLQQLPFANREDFDDAHRGLIEALPGGIIKTGEKINWNLNRYDFLKNDTVPQTVNPSLWRIAQLNLENGLFKVTDRVYQVRGFDLSNMTIIEGNTGLIIVDTLITTEVAKAALNLYYQHRPKKPVVAVIFTHSHADHYGGVKGVISEADVISGKVKLLAPEGFLEEAVSENIFAGNAMARRTLYQYGAFLPPSERGQVDAGLGKSTSFGSLTLIPPNDIIKKTGEKRVIDGVEMEFQMAPNTEAPAEMLIYFPQFKLLDAAEDLTHTMHNLYTLRGAKVRDSAQWWKTVNESIERYGRQLEVIIAQHHWPMWGQQRIVDYMGYQRDMYKYTHDQTLRLANQGETPIEIAEELKLPEEVANKWYNRGYYGSLNHNAKAVYQRYLGWYDSNPANLYPLPPVELGKEYVAFMGGEDVILDKAKKAFDEGKYRFVADVLKHVVFANPTNQDARNLQADAMEQLGYQTENPTWRNEFLMGAFELRNGVPKIPGLVTATPDAVSAMSTDLLLDYMGIRLNGPKANGKLINIQWKQPDTGQIYALELRNGVLIYTQNKALSNPDATITASKNSFAALLMDTSTLKQEMDKGVMKVDGQADSVSQLFALLDKFDPMFNIVTP